MRPDERWLSDVCFFFFLGILHLVIHSTYRLPIRGARCGAEPQRNPLQPGTRGVGLTQ
ncbi:hypothetical protein L218DRAFT_770269 [Marasmius fiardii PR-910]|nr:hypothetical protein L218DRAFT_770269 [Marasmius fiardii PR-910]